MLDNDNKVSPSGGESQRSIHHRNNANTQGHIIGNSFKQGPNG